MIFDCGCAKELYARCIHPRVLIGPDDIAPLRRLVRTGDGRTIMNGLRLKMRTAARAILEIPDLRDELSSVAPRQRDRRAGFMHSLLDLALVSVLDEDAEATEAALRMLCALPAMPAAGLVYFMFCGQHPIAFDLLYRRLTPEERRAYATHVADSVREVVSKGQREGFFKQSGSNIPLSVYEPGVLGLLAVRGEPGVPDLTDLLAENILMLEASLNTAICVNGYPEEDMGYGTLMVSRLAMLCETLRRSGLYDAYVECPRYGRFGAALLHFVQPWGRHLSTTGDHGDDFGGREWVLPPQAAALGTPELLWLFGTLSYGPRLGKTPPAQISATAEVELRKGVQAPASACSLLFSDRYKRAVHPSRRRVPTAFCDRDRGLVSFRSGWGADDTMVVFDGSQRCASAQGHMHASCGHFSLSALGEYFAIDTGRYNIEQNCHNLVLVDGQSGRSTNGEWVMTFWHGNLIDYVPGAFCDFAAVDSSHQHDCYWARRYTGMVKGPQAPAYLWTVEDINKANDWAEYWWQLHTSPENVIALKKNSATIKGWRHGNLLDVHFALPAADEYPKPHTLSLAQDIAESSSYKYANAEYFAKRYARPSDMVHYSAFLRPRLLAKVGGYNGRFMSVMLPRLKGAPAARVVRLPSLPNTLAVKIEFQSVEDTLIFAREHNLLDAGNVTGRGQWCVVRRSRKTGRVLAWELGHGTRLSVGKTVLK